MVSCWKIAALLGLASLVRAQLNIANFSTTENCSPNDGCLSILNQMGDTGTTFCDEFTATEISTPTNLPEWLGACKSDTARISSACDCKGPKSSCTPTTVVVTITSK